jgi:hypothetical protein
MFLRGNLGPAVFFGVKFRQRILELPPLQRLLFFFFLEKIANNAVSVSFAANLAKIST